MYRMKDNEKIKDLQRTRAASTSPTSSDDKSTETKCSSKSGLSRGRNDLAVLERDAVAKARTRIAPKTTSVSIGTKISDSHPSKLENESGNISSSGTSLKSGATEDLQTMEGEVLQKNRSIAGSCEVKQSKISEITGMSKHQIERKGRSTACVGQLHEATICALDERIEQKTRIATEGRDQDLIRSKHEGVIRSRTENHSIKVSALSKEAMDAAFEKYQARVEGLTLGPTDRKLDCAQDGVYRGFLHLGLDVETGEDPMDDRLAVAVAVKDADENTFIPAAIEYDPEAKPPIYRNRRFRLYGLFACSLLAAMFAGVIGLLTQNKDRDTISQVLPTADTTRPGSLGIQEQIELTVGSEVLNDKESAHYRAMEWIIDQDSLQLSPEDPNLVQRYLLAVVYFELHQEGDWLSCNAPTDEDTDGFCLYKKMVNINPLEYRSISWFRWLSSNHECTWAGLFCDEFDQLRTIDLTGQEIKGTIPIELTYFPFLQAINLSWNAFYGTLPKEYGNLPHLLNLEVHHNDFTGTIPSEWGKSKNMQLLNLASNSLTGTIPSEIGDMTNLRGLFIYENILSGTIPTELAQLSLLTYIRMQRNFFTGTIPSELGNLSAREVWLHRTLIEGSIPSEIGKMDKLVDLRIHSTSINGTIPEELWQLTNLFRLDLYDTKLSGTLSSNIAQLTQLDSLRLRDTELFGSIPSEIGTMSDIGRIWLERTDLTGEVPSALCAFKERNGLQQLVADCLPSSETGVPRVTCSCCDLCCDHTTGVCDA